MQVIAIGKMKEFLQANLRLYEDPVLLITSDYYAGCPNCKSDATIFRLKLSNRTTMEATGPLHQITDHKFPFDVFITIPDNAELPSKIVIGTRPTGSELELVIRQISYAR